MSGANAHRSATYKSAIGAALRDAMAANPKTMLLGQDVGKFSILGLTAGLQQQFGADRVRDCPISESAMVGMGVGAALAGWTTSIEVAYADIIAVAFSSLVHSAAKMRFASNGRLNAPVIVRAPIGRYSRHGPMGTEVTASWFYNVPDIRIVMPATPSEAYWHLLDAFVHPGPTLFLEDKSLYGAAGAAATSRPSPSQLVREGDELTIVGAGRAAAIACEAADRLAASARPIACDVLSLGIVKPLDLDPVRRSIERTGRLLVVQDEPRYGGYGPIILSELAEARSVDRPIRMHLHCREDTFLPYIKEEDHLPTPQTIVACAERLSA